MSECILIIQNADDDPPALLEEEARAAGVPMDLRRVYLGDRIPDDPAGYCAVVVLGGSMSAADDASFPQVREEMDLLRTAVDAGMSVMGVCLGAQILARALGSRVYENAVPELSFTALRDEARSSADPVLGASELWPRVMSWHFDTFDLPRGAKLLASSAQCAIQAFRLGAGQYGIQFHPETTRPWLDIWVERFELQYGPDARMDELRREVDLYLASAEVYGRALFRRWIALSRAGVNPSL